MRAMRALSSPPLSVHPAISVEDEAMRTSSWVLPKIIASPWQESRKAHIKLNSALEWAVIQLGGFIPST